MSATNATVPCPEGDVNGPHGTCSPENHRTLQTRVDATQRDIKTDCNATQDCATLLAHITFNRHASEDRAHMNNLCFGGGDEGQRQALTNALAAQQKCQACYDAKCRPNSTPPPPKTIPLDNPDAMKEKSDATGLKGSSLTASQLA